MARRFFFDINLEHCLIRGTAGQPFHSDGFEKGKILNALTRTAQFCRVKSVSLNEPKLPSDHLVLGADIANDINSFNKNPWAFVYFENNINFLILTIAVDPWPNIDKSVSKFTDLVGQIIDGVVDLFDVVPITLFEF